MSCDGKPQQLHVSAMQAARPSLSASLPWVGPPCPTGLLFHTLNGPDRRQPGGQRGPRWPHASVDNGESGSLGGARRLMPNSGGKHFMWEFFGFLCQRKQQTQSISQGLPSAARLHRQLRPAPACLVLPPRAKHSSATCTGRRPQGSCPHSPKPCLGHTLQGSWGLQQRPAWEKAVKRHVLLTAGWL